MIDARSSGKLRLAIFGGSFDPVHIGHLLVAQAAREELGLDQVCFVPAAKSPFKPDSEPAPAGLRLRMLRLALAGLPWCRVDDQEISRGGFSYTIETIRRYTEDYPEAELHWIIGADHVGGLPQWREAGELAQLVRFIVVQRPTEPQAPLPFPFQGVYLRGFPLALSSSQIRSRVQQGLSIRLLTTETVAELIHKNRLYL
ncbi:MAG: nicotinate-nucleotide adenylyltransferase [Verrucomicrobiota bacterium]|jgi:nicotinate-nucleotide adenylyltransferase